MSGGESFTGLSGAVASGKKAIEVLLVEEDARDARLLREMFSKEQPGSFELTHLARMSEAVAHLARGGVDVVLMSMRLPDGHGIENLRRARAAAPDVAMIVLTGLDDESLAAEAIREGAQNYLIKGEIEHRALPRALRHAAERDRIREETELIRRRQSQMRDEFLSRVSYQLRLPLSSIYSFTQGVANGSAGEINPQQDEYLQIILRNVLQLQGMIEDLLEISQVQAGKLGVQPQPLRVEDLIADAVDALNRRAAEKEIILSFHRVGGLPQAYADARRILQVLSILLDNAVKFTPVGGAIHIQAGVYEKEPGYLLVEVSDTGCGILPEATTRIFEPLYQVTDPTVDGDHGARRGLGLGLHIGRELITRLGGEIWALSEPQKGSRFLFTLPIFSPAASKAPFPSEVNQAELPTPSPLAHLRRRLTAALRNAGQVANLCVIHNPAGI